MVHRFGIFWLSVVLFLELLMPAKTISAQDSKYVPRIPQDKGMVVAPRCYSPKDPWLVNEAEHSCESHEAWLNDVKHWRAERRIRIGYDGRRYEIPTLQWTQRSFIQ